jgi:putative hydrolase of the HAD superfamily
MNARKKNSLMIGDSWDADIQGAMKFGIDQIYYSPMTDLRIADPLKTNKTSTIIIASLTDLFEIL